jgi:hypothetical protein
VATAAIISLNAPSTTKKILHLTFRRTKTLKEKLLFELDPYDFHWVSRESVKQNPYVWKTNLLGGGRLHRMMDRLLRDAPTLGKYLEEKRENHGWQFGEGYSVGYAKPLNDLPHVTELLERSPEELKERHNLKGLPQLAPWLTGKPGISSKALTQTGIDRETVQPLDKFFFERPRKTIQQIFSAPHVLIREIVDGAAIPAMYTDEYSVFTNQIIGVHAPDSERNQLKILAERLNPHSAYPLPIFRIYFFVPPTQQLEQAQMMLI